MSENPTISIGWDVIITLIIAIYGALVSTYSVWGSRQEHKREIKVELAYGFMRNSLSEVSPLMLILSALNTGRRTVTLTSMGLILPKKDKKYLVFLQPESNVSFPYDLLEGKNCNVWTTTKELAEDLKREGYSGKISLKGYYKDAIGGEYKSKSLKFNIEKP
jgi:hypothetical protein